MKNLQPRLLISIGLLVIAFAAYSLYQTWSWTQYHLSVLVSQQNQLSLAFDKAIRGYVGDVVRPEMSRRIGAQEFFPETMSTSFVARSVFDKVRAEIPHIVLKFAAENPRNPVNTATPEEIEIINYFRKHPQETIWSGNLDIDGKQYYTRAHARRMELKCLQCHGRPEDVPAALLEKYGRTAGFGKSIGDVSLDLVAIPVATAQAAVGPMIRDRIVFTLGALLLFLGGLGYCLWKDVSERTQAAQQLSATKEFLENIFTTVIDGLIVTDAKGYVVRINKTMQEIIGYTQAEIAGKHVVELGALEQPYIDIAAEMMSTLREKGAVENHETAMTRKDGSLVPIEFNITFLKDSDGHTTGAVGGVRDISQRKKVEAELKESEERYRAIAETATDAIITINREGTIVFWNPAAATIFGHSAQEAIGQSFEIILLERYREPMRQWMEYIFSTGDLQFPKEVIEGPGMRKDGTEVPLEISLSLWESAHGFFSTAILRDITARKHAAQQIKESRDFLENIFKASADGILITGLRSVVTMANDAMVKMIGYPRQEILGKAMKDFIPPEEVYEKKAFEFITRLLDEGTVSCFEMQLLGKEGRIVDVEASAGRRSGCWPGGLPMT